MENYRLIACTEDDYKAWKNDELLLDMNMGALVDLPDGVALRDKVLRYVKKKYINSRFYTKEPKSFESLNNYEKLQGALTYSEFKELTEHVDKKIVNGVVALMIKVV